MFRANKLNYTEWIPYFRKAENLLCEYIQDMQQLAPGMFDQKEITDWIGTESGLGFLKIKKDRALFMQVSIPSKNWKSQEFHLGIDWYKAIHALGQVLAE